MRYKIKNGFIIYILFFAFLGQCNLLFSVSQDLAKQSHTGNGINTFSLRLAMKSDQQAKKSEYNRSADIEIGFFESLDLTAEQIMQDISNSKMQKIKSKPEQSSNSQSISSQSLPLTATQKHDQNQLLVNQQQNKSLATLTSWETTTMWQYILLFMASIVFVLVIMVLLRIYRNTQLVESPDNIVQQIKALSVDIDTQNKSIREIRHRIQKTENSFIRVLSHHIDEKYEQLIKDVDMQLQEFVGTQKTLAQQGAEVSHKVDAMESLLTSLKEFVATQKSEIRRLHEGYDWSIINHISVATIDVIDKIDQQLSECDGSIEAKYLEEVRDDLTTLLESYHIKKSMPMVGSEYSEQDNAKSYKVTMVESQEPRLRGTIARVIKPSYVYRMSADKKRIIRGAEIEVYN